MDYLGFHNHLNYAKSDPITSCALA